MPQEAIQQSKQPISLADIQQQQLIEEEQKGKETKVTAAVSNLEPVAAPASSMSFQLKSLLGVKGGENLPGAKPKPAWSSTKAAEASNTSLKEIMNEEINQKKQTDPIPRAQGSSWAAKAKIGVPEPVVVDSKMSTNSSEKILSAPAIEVSRRVEIFSKSSTDVKKTVDKSDFGGKLMSPDLAEWCSAQLKKINGSDDLTLMQFCMSLKSSVEIREYLAQYLGSSPQVTNFATEFIKFKEDGKKPSAVNESSESVIRNNSSNLSNMARKKKTTK